MIRKSVKVFAEAMELKLKENDYKGGWHDRSGWDEENFAYLLRRLKEEVVELENSAHNSHKEIKKECVDVANFAMMIFDNSTK